MLPSRFRGKKRIVFGCGCRNEKIFENMKMLIVLQQGGIERMSFAV